jgi:hypothetical protein
MSPTSPLSQLPIWQAVVAILVPMVGFVAWLAVLGARVQTLESELTSTASRIEASVEKQGGRLDVITLQVTEQASDVRWIRERLAERRSD